MVDIEELQNKLTKIKGIGNILVQYYITLYFELSEPVYKTPQDVICEGINKFIQLDSDGTERQRLRGSINYTVYFTMITSHANMDYVRYEVNKIINRLNKELKTFYKDIKVDMGVDSEIIDIFDLLDIEQNQLDKVVQNIREEIKYRG